MPPHPRSRLVTGSGFWVDKREEAWALGGSPVKRISLLRCTELNTGKLQWSQPGFRMGLSMSAAEGRIYVRSHRTLTLVEANSHAHVEKGRIENVHDLRNTGANSHKGLLDWNMPVIARDGCLSEHPSRSFAMTSETAAPVREPKVSNVRCSIRRRPIRACVLPVVVPKAPVDGAVVIEDKVVG